MKNFATIAVAVTALALGGCGKKDEPAVQETPGSVAAGAASDTPVMPINSGQAFVDAAASSDAFEIESSKLAEAQGSSAKVKSFAAQMVKAHTDSTAKLKTAASAATPPLTPAPLLNPTQQQALDALKAKSGAEFDTAYAQAQVDAHQKALDMLRAYSASGDVLSLKAFAGELVPVVTGHLNMAKGL